MLTRYYCAFGFGQGPYVQVAFGLLSRLLSGPLDLPLSKTQMPVQTGLNLQAHSRAPVQSVQ